MKRLVKILFIIIRQSRTAIIASMILGGCVIASAMIIENPPTYDLPKVERVATVMKVAVTPVKRTDYQSTIDSFGKIQTTGAVTLSSQVAGDIKQISADLFVGGMIRQGQTLLEINPTELRQTLTLAKLSLDKALIKAEKHKHARLQKSKELILLRENPRFADLLKDYDSSASDQQLDSQRESIEVNIALERAKKEYETARQKLVQAKITAPFDGKIVKVSLKDRQRIGAGQVIAELYPIEALEVRLPLKIFDLPYIHAPNISLAPVAAPSSRVSVMNNLLDGQTDIWQGQVHRVELSVDKKHNAVHVVARIPAPFSGDNLSKTPLVVGQFVSVSIQGKKLEDRIMVPRDLIHEGTYVYTYRDGEIHKNRITVGWRDAQYAEITGGLVEGDLLVTTALKDVFSGTPAEIEEPLADALTLAAIVKKQQAIK